MSNPLEETGASECRLSDASLSIPILAQLYRSQIVRTPLDNNKGQTLHPTLIKRRNNSHSVHGERQTELSNVRYLLEAPFHMSSSMGNMSLTPQGTASYIAHSLHSG